ncbi:MAG: porin family protein, partial [Flavitalea sp.]
EDNQEANTGHLTDFHAGILAHIHLNNSLALQPEVIYSRQGAEYPNLGTERINYVNIPILLQVMLSKGMRLQTGPQLGIMTNAKLERYSGGVTDVKDQFENACLSWSLGLGYLSPIGLGVDARYNLGLINIVNDSQHDVKNRVWQFGLFYQFNR